MTQEDRLYGYGCCLILLALQLLFPDIEIFYIVAFLGFAVIELSKLG